MKIHCQNGMKYKRLGIPDDIHMDLASKTVECIMEPMSEIAYEWWSINSLMDYFSRTPYICAPVYSDCGKFRGVVTITDVIKFQRLPSSDILRLIEESGEIGCEDITYIMGDKFRLAMYSILLCKVKQVMMTTTISINKSVSVGEAISFLLKYNTEQIFVTDREKIIGVIGHRQIMCHNFNLIRHVS